MEQSTKQNSDLFLVTYDTTCDLFTSDEMESLQKPFIKSDLQKGIKSIKQVKCLEDQKHEIEDLSYQFTSNTSILNSLIKPLYKIEANSKEYTEALENISHFVHSNFIDFAKEKIDILNSVLEYEGTKH